MKWNSLHQCKLRLHWQLTLHALAGDSRSAFARNKTVLGDGWSPAALIRLLHEWCSEAGMGTQFNDYLAARKECMDFAFQELDRLEIEALRYVSLCGLSTCLELLNQIWRCNQCAGKGDRIEDANFCSSGNASLRSLLACVGLIFVQCRWRMQDTKQQFEIANDFGIPKSAGKE